MGFVKDIFRARKIWKDPEFLEAVNGPRGRVSTPFSDAGGVRFSSRDVEGELGRYVLLYAERRDGGAYDVAAMREGDFDAGSRPGMTIGTLDHVPVDGEHVIGWIPEEDQFSLEAELAAERARRYMTSNGFGIWLVYFVFSKDNPRNNPTSPLCGSVPPAGAPAPFLAPRAGETLVVCNVPPSRVLEHEGGPAARVPCDAGGDGTVYVSLGPSEAADDPWHAGMKALFLGNAPSRTWWHAGAGGLPGGGALEEDTARIVAHVKMQEQLNREAGLAAWGEPTSD